MVGTARFPRLRAPTAVVVAAAPKLPRFRAFVSVWPDRSTVGPSLTPENVLVAVTAACAGGTCCPPLLPLPGCSATGVVPALDPPLTIGRAIEV